MAAIPRLVAPPRIGGLTVRELLEAGGFQLMNRDRGRQVRHALLIPNDFKLVRDKDEEDWKSPAVWVEDGVPTETWWSSITVQEVPAESTDQCLWNLLALSAESTPRQRFHNREIDEQWILELKAFVSKWGLLDHGSENGWETASEAWRSLDDWADAAQEARDALYLLILTERQDEVPESAIELIAEWADVEIPPLPPPPNVHTLMRRSPEEEWELRLQAVRRQRRSGLGLDLQRSAAVNLLASIREPPEYRQSEYLLWWPIDYTWDEDGRRLESAAIGVREIVALHLQAVFDSPQIDVFICSVCGRLFPVSSGEGERRPRSGVKQLCSDECRLAAKRESNRASWHKNKDRWQKGSTHGKAK